MIQLSVPVLIISLFPGCCALLVAAPIFHLVQMRRSLPSGKTRWPLVFLLSQRTPTLIVGTTHQVQCASSPNICCFRVKASNFHTPMGGYCWHKLNLCLPRLLKTAHSCKYKNNNLFVFSSSRDGNFNTKDYSVFTGNYYTIILRHPTPPKGYNNKLHHLLPHKTQMYD